MIEIPTNVAKKSRRNQLFLTGRRKDLCREFELEILKIPSDKGGNRNTLEIGQAIRSGQQSLIQNH